MGAGRGQQDVIAKAEALRKSGKKITTQAFQGKKWVCPNPKKVDGHVGYENNPSATKCSFPLCGAEKPGFKEEIAKLNASSPGGELSTESDGKPSTFKSIGTPKLIGIGV